MTSPKLLIAGLLGAALFTFTGCISTSETTYRDIERTKVAFASDKAGRVFYEALQGTPEHHPRTEKRTDVNLILLNVEQRVVSGPNQTFNEAVAFCDTDHDGVISETEAEIFASAWPRHRS